MQPLTLDNVKVRSIDPAFNGVYSKMDPEFGVLAPFTDHVALVKLEGDVVFSSVILSGQQVELAMAVMGKVSL